MDADDRHLFVIRTIEDADVSARRQRFDGAPQIVVLQFFDRRLLERMHLGPLRTDPGHHMTDHVVLPRRIHPLKDQQQGPTAFGVEQLFAFREALQPFLKMVLGIVLVLERPDLVGIVAGERVTVAVTHAKAVDIHNRCANESVPRSRSVRSDC